MSRLAEEECVSVRRTLEAEDDAEQRRLPAPVRPRDRNELSLRDPQVDVFEHALPGPVAERDAIQLDC